MLLQSQNFDVTWGKTTVTVTADTTVAPDGTTTADTLTASTTSGYVSQSVVFTADGDKSFSVFLKAGTSTSTRLTLRDTTAPANRATIDITWTAGVPSGVAAAGTLQGIDNFGNGWYRVRGLATGVIAANANQFRFSPDFVDGTNNVIMWGAQAENGAFATSYIPTVASQVTRAADQTSIVAPNFAPWYNQSEGTFVCDFDTNTLNASATSVYASVFATDGTANNFNGLYNYGNFVGGAVRTGNVTQADINGGGSPANNTTIKSAIAYATNDIAVTVNGATPVTDTSAVIGTTMNQLTIGNRNNLNYRNGHIRSIRYYPTRLSNAQLQALTA